MDHVTSPFVSRDGDKQGDLTLQMGSQESTWFRRIGGRSSTSRRKENQDLLVLYSDLRSNLYDVPPLGNAVHPHDHILVGVLDGHGKHGKVIPEVVSKCFANYCQEQHPQSESQQPQTLSSETSPTDTQTQPSDTQPQSPDTPNPSPDTLNSSSDTLQQPAEPSSPPDTQQPAPEEPKEEHLSSASFATPDPNPSIETATAQETKSHPNVEDVLHTMYNNAHDILSNTDWGGFNSRYSGTTTSLIYLTPTSYTIANVGDTDIVVGYLDESTSGEILAEKVSITHRPGLDQEAERIRAAGGLVEAQRNRSGNPGRGPLRIWMKDVRTPGLMVSRSIGDSVSHDQLGVIADPFVATRQIDQARDKFIIIASDGVWDFVSVKEACEYVDMFLDPFVAANYIVEVSVSRQKPKQYDNATAVVIFLENLVQREERLRRQHEDYDVLLAQKMDELKTLEALNKTQEISKKVSMSTLVRQENEGDHHTHVEFVESNIDHFKASGEVPVHTKPMADPKEKSNSCCSVS